MKDTKPDFDILLIHYHFPPTLFSPPTLPHITSHFFHHFCCFFVIQFYLFTSLQIICKKKKRWFLTITIKILVTCLWNIYVWTYAIYIFQNIYNLYVWQNLYWIKEIIEQKCWRWRVWMEYDKRDMTKFIHKVSDQLLQ